MGNIMRFHPKPATRSVDYGTPILRPGARLKIWERTFRLIHRTTTGNHNIQDVDTGDVETVDWIDYVELWKAGELKVLEVPAGSLPACKERLRNIPADLFTPEQQAVIKRNRYYCNAVKDALIARTIENTSSDNIETLRKGLAKPKGYEDKDLLSRGQIQKLYSAWEGFWRARLGPGAWKLLR